MNQWLQIDLANQHTKVTRIATQGRNAYNQWVTKYKLLFSDNGVNFHYYKEQGNVAIKVRQTFTTNRALTILCKTDIQRNFHFICQLESMRSEVMQITFNRQNSIVFNA